MRKTVARDRAQKAVKSANGHAAKRARSGLGHRRLDKRQSGQHRVIRKLRLITNGDLDGRSRASVQFSKIVRNVTTDLGGDDMLTEIERHLITSFAGAAILQGHQVAKLLSGEPIDVDEYSAVTTSMLRSATRLGTQRRARDVTPTLKQYLEQEAAE